MDFDPVWHPYTPNPSIGPQASFIRAQGQYVFDADGRRYFDATSSWWCNLHGHCHPRLVNALSEQAKVLDQILLSPHSHPVATELAAKLLKVMGRPFYKVFYSDDGSTAVEAALKMLLQYWHIKGEQRKIFVSMQGAYHGDTLGAVAVSDTPQFHRFFDIFSLRQTWKVAQPYCYRCPVGLERKSCHLECADSIGAVLKEHHTEIAGFIVEPLVMGAGGMVVYPADYVQQILFECKKYGIPVIFDEVFTGFGRTGSLFAFEQFELKPDIVCLSKGLTSGMLPLGATVASEMIWEVFQPGPEKTFFHGHTFTGNALSCRVALESLKLLEEDQTLRKNLTLSQEMQSHSDRFRSLEWVGDVRALGMIWALELVENKREKKCFTPSNQLGWLLAEKLWEEGVWVRPLNQVLYLVPPYCSTVQDLRHALDTLYFFLEKRERIG